MMTDKRSLDGWRRLGAKVMEQVATDDPAGLAEVKALLDHFGQLWVEAMAAQAGMPTTMPHGPERPYSHAEIAADLGVTRQAVTKRLANR